MNIIGRMKLVCYIMQTNESILLFFAYNTQINQFFGSFFKYLKKKDSDRLKTFLTEIDFQKTGYVLIETDIKKTG